MEEQKKDAANEETVTAENEQAEVIDMPAEEEAEDNSSNEKIAALEKEKEEIYNRLLRTQAEFDNYKKRSIKEREADRKYKSQDLINELLPALDNFERAMQMEVTDENRSLFEGISMVYRQLQDALKTQGVEVIESEGKEFDPSLHHAVMQIEDEAIESNTVVEELQKGYMLKDRVVRPAMVKVNK